MSIKNLTLALVTTLCTILTPAQLKADPPLKKIAITQLVQHEAADLVRDGILYALLNGGYENGKTATIIYENAQGNPGTAAQIARNFAGMDLDIIMPITTISTQTVVKAMKGKNTPIVFSAVTDPVGSGIVKTIEDSGENVTGVMDMPPIPDQIAFIKDMLPKAKTIGLLYNPGDEGSAISIQVVKREAQKNGFTVIESPATRSVDIKGAVQNLVGKVDAIYVPLDNTFVSAMRTVAQLTTQSKIPLFSADSGSVVDGAFACLGYSYFDHGRLAGEVAVEILNGKPAKDISVREMENKTVYINAHVAEQLDVIIPKDIASKANFL